MFIKKITIENFQSYHDVNSAKLDNNLNLFLGTIGAGKSKLFNAFYWCFFGSIYKYEEKWVDISSANFLSIFNKKRLRKTEVNEKIKAQVTLTIQAEKLYKVSHFIEISKEKAENYNSEMSWRFIKEEQSISFDNSSGNRIILEGMQAREYIDKKLLPAQISKYIWFQGETLNELLDIYNGITFKNAVNFISYIKYYDSNIELISNLINKVEKSLRKEKRKDTANATDFNNLSSEIDQIEEEIQNNKNELDNLKIEHQKIQDVIDKIDKRLDDIPEYDKLINEQNLLETNLRHISKEIEDSNKNIGNVFAKHWTLYKTDDILKQGYEKLHTYQTWYQQNRNDNPSGLPYDIPDPKYLLEMLDKKKCYICGEEFEDNSAAFKHIKERYNKATDVMNKFREKNKEELDVFEKVIDLSSNKSIILSKVDTIQLNIINHQETNERQNEEKNNIQERLAEINDEITILQEKHGNQLQSLRLEKNKYNYNMDEKEEITGKIRIAEKEISSLENKLQQKKTALDNLPAKNKKSYKEENILHYLYELQEVYKISKEAEFEKLITKIEDKANNILLKITKANKVINGKIQIDRKRYTIRLVDLDNPNDKRDSNTGHNTLMKMCVINAIVLISYEYKNKSYPFIADAPTSDLDDGTTKLYYKFLNEEFKQSIIMSKDLFTFKENKNEVEIDSLKKDFGFNNVYHIEKQGADNNLTESNSYSVLNKII